MKRGNASLEVSATRTRVRTRMRVRASPCARIACVSARQSVHACTRRRCTHTYERLPLSAHHQSLPCRIPLNGGHSPMCLLLFRQVGSRCVALPWSFVRRIQCAARARENDLQLPALLVSSWLHRERTSAQRRRDRVGVAARQKRVHGAMVIQKQSPTRRPTVPIPQSVLELTMALVSLPVSAS